MAVAIVIAAVLATGCNPSKRALKNIHKAERLDETVPAKYCAEKYPPTDSIHEKIVVKPGKVVTDTIIDTYIDVIRDTVFVTKLKTITQKITDTVETTKYEQVVNRAKEALLEAENKELSNSNAKLSTKLKTWRSIACILGIAWVLFFVFMFIKRKFKAL